MVKKNTFAPPLAKGIFNYENIKKTKFLLSSANKISISDIKKANCTKI